MTTRRFFFAHVHKAAGTSLVVRMKHQFRPEQVYPDRTDEAPLPSGSGDDEGRFPRATPTLVVDHLLERYRARRSEIVVVSGHFPLRTTELLGDEFTTLTVLRDPVERTLSSLRHYRQRSPNEKDQPLEALYEDPMRFHGLIHNHMVKMFSLSPEEILAGGGVLNHVDPFTRERLDEAKARLASVDVLGLQDHYEDFCRELTERFGWQLGPTVRANTTKPVAVDPVFRRRIAADNALDVELYEHARALWESRNGSGTPTARGQIPLS